MFVGPNSTSVSRGQFHPAVLNSREIPRDFSETKGVDLRGPAGGKVQGFSLARAGDPTGRQGPGAAIWGAVSRHPEGYRPVVMMRRETQSQNLPFRRGFAAQVLSYRVLSRIEATHRKKKATRVRTNQC